MIENLPGREHEKTGTSEIADPPHGGNQSAEETEGASPGSAADAPEGETGAENRPTASVSATPETLIGGEATYVVKKNETLRMVGAKTGVSWKVIAKLNGIDPKKPLPAGKVLRLDTRRIVPKTLEDGILINIPDRTLYLFRDGKLRKTYPVGLGMKKCEELFSWQTPTGRFRIISKVKNPTWYVPPTVQKKLKKQGKAVVTMVPPGPKNPLGGYALRTSIGGILIHSTLYPESVNSFRSHGCVRLLPSDMETFFNTIRVNTRGEIIYEPVKVAVSEDGHVFMEAHSDVYNKVRDLESETKRLLREMNAVDRVDWRKVKGVLKSGNGIVEDITLPL